MIIRFLQKNRFFRRIIYKAGKSRAKDMINKIKPFLDKNDAILDIGSGTCNVCQILFENHYKISPLDVQDLSFVNNIKPVIYDGVKIPYDNNKFDKVLILTVLHHTPNPENVLKEAKRVSKRIIIIEDIYSNWLHKYITYFFDSLLNLEFIGHPHTNKNDKQWKKTFKKLGLKLIDTKYDHSFLVFKHATYYLEK
ncbi:MAG: Methyltransferase type 11 [Candidatus Nomurabacteria bacterium GW2011_GWA2_40_9]|uniref:Methyltransferase type 11 n=1 Tax=Candidatus Nomurabacteria bacterium GW2011_GWA2_40_9 TaxID=1618734 RepID=A0A0G0TN20_9BACT|nr:MAG: Methyltransferase type 11 [Candidatus Nomurabacteria bacterium GW2011_GWA2_40_9]